MPVYALLGATGSTGSSILRSLLSNSPENLTLNIFIRSKSKLLSAFPDLETTASFNVNIIEGTPDDNTAMQKCLHNVDVIMAVIGSNVSNSGITLIYDTAVAIVNALKVHQKTQGASYKPPTVIQLRSTSLNPVFRAQSWIASTMASFCFYYIYADLERACTLFNSVSTTVGPDSPALLSYIFADPPSIHDPDGTVPTGYELILDGKQETALSYADLGAAFCELARRREEFLGKGVGVSATGHVNQVWGPLVGYMIAGAKSRVW